MDDATQRARAGPSVFLAGLQAGMMAVLLMLGWLGVSAVWQQHTFWTVANQMATVLHGGSAVIAGFGPYTASGIALYLVAYSLLGAVFAMAAPHGLTPFGKMLAGVLLSIAWYWLWFQALGQKLMPLVWLLHSERPMVFGHVLYGVMLARYPVYLKNPEPAPTQVPAQSSSSPDPAS